MSLFFLYNNQQEIHELSYGVIKMAIDNEGKFLKNVSLFSLKGFNDNKGGYDHIIFSINGTISVLLDRQAYSLNKNDVIYLPFDKNCRIEGKGSNLILDFSFYHSFFDIVYDSYNSELVCNSCADTERDYTPVRQQLIRIASTWFSENSTENTLLLTSQYYSFAYYLQCYHCTNEMKYGLKDIPQKYLSRVNDIVSYIRNHYDSALSLQELSEHLHLSMPYLSKFIKDYLGTNFNSYLNDVRLIHALEDMLESTNSITTIAYKNGFPNMNAFNKAFRKKYELTPNQYRKEMAAKKEDSKEEDTVSRIPFDFNSYKSKLDKTLFPSNTHQEYMLYPSQNTYLIKDAQVSVKTACDGKSVINVGYVQNLLQASIQGQLRDTLKKIHFDYVRIMNAMSMEIIMEDPGEKRYNFARLDRITVFLLSLGVKPYINMSPSNSLLVIKPNEFISVGGRSRESKSVDNSIYAKILEDYIYHSISVFGASEVEKWIFEFDSEIDEHLNLNENVYHYLDRLESSISIFRSRVPNVKIAAVNFNVSGSYDEFNKILDGMAVRKIYPDMISLTMFPYEKQVSDGNAFLYTRHTHYIMKSYQHCRQVLSSHPTLTQELVVASFGENIISRNFVNDSCFQAAFIAQNLIDLFDEAPMIGFWSLSDVITESSDTASFLFGGNGILTSHSIPKPGFFVLEEFNSVGRNVILKNHGFLMTKTDTNQYYIVLCNYSHLNSYNCLNLDNVLPLTDVNAAFEIPDTKDNLIEIHNVKPGSYCICTTSINREHGSILDEWVKYSGGASFSSLADVEYIRDITHPQKTKEYIQCTDGVMKIHAQLLQHEARFISIFLEYENPPLDS